MKVAGGRTGVEAVVAFVAGAGWFTLCAILLGAVLPHRLVAVLAVVALDVVVVLALAHFWGIN